ncbi:TRAP transporter, DctQ-like membrane protein [Alloalcanivorax dieselolei B5]|uniref:TRAP transporter small permease protein n=1 Tax=Alcanivorax dieselolei (strain DSM 16502 / CGMCC 1.3690 / MCCC 1A00001 / B-5) TaxID=930169 RepID=K0CF98_ALCDB|nr:MULTISPECIES: TRAP transporter small permease [Alloalcanivorax]AFT71303.1 TRAP transporter, DctQ-like membrane protein [Alloalcanivorax dieselolei B5]GGJ94660.1 hypothetical protein GCM10007426_24580 [Alloalcanivorax dieselolei]CUR45591.1 TRAP-type C4-dicarboxylate transport system, small permease component [Alloalcanivorax xenomutans]
MASNKLAATITTAMDRIDTILVFLAQLILAALMMLTFVNVVGRALFQQSLPDGLIVSEMMLVAIVFLPLSYVQSMGAHLEVTVFTDLLPARVQKALFCAGLAAGILVFGHMAWLGWLSAHESFKTGGYGFSAILYIPEWPARMLIPLGLGWWCLRMLTQLIWPSSQPEQAESELQLALENAGLDDQVDRFGRRDQSGDKR